MLIASPGGDRLLEAGSQHLITFDTTFEIDPEAAFGPLQLELPRPGGGKFVVLCQIEAEYGDMEFGEVPPLESRARVSSDSWDDIQDRYLDAIEEELRVNRIRVTLETPVYVVRVKIIEGHEVEPSVSEYLMPDAPQEWDE